MWIRSQDGNKVVLATQVSLIQDFENNLWAIMVNGEELATYSTKEQAEDQIGTITALLYNNKNMYELQHNE